MKIKEITFTALMAAVCCILAPISVPIGPVPVSLVVLAALFCVFAVGTKLGTLAFTIFLLLGAAGLPVFSGWQGGIAKLAGPTGGYLIGCIPMILIAGAFITISEKRKGALKYVIQAVGLAIGVLVCYALGTAWFMIESGSDLMTSLTLCVLPFLPFDAIKIAIAMIVGNPLRVALSKADLMHYGAKA
ncbi:MAG: biotin transporter BioY [Lachnospiraceae bacterium]|nr:biotin transporter BioY [Lachnospiraceae bacterium]MDY2759404.1 biotin transporter BioY [Lachnospiraceae bacterium]